MTRTSHGKDPTVPADELERAKNYLALGLPRRFETTAAVASQLADLEVYGQDIGFYNDYVDRVMAVTAADVQRIAREYIRPAASVVVIVGDREQIEPRLRALQIGPIEVRDLGEFMNE